MEIKISVVMEERTRECIERLADALSGGIKVSAHAENVQVADGAPEKDSGKSPDVPADGTQHQKGPAGNWTTCDVKETEDVTPAEKVENAADTTDGNQEREIPIQSAVPAYTDGQLTAACAEASRLGLGSQVRELIRGTYKVSKVSEIPEDLRGGFIGDLRGLGVRI